MARLLNAAEVLVEPFTDAAARVAGLLCGASAASDVVDASVVVAARRYDATVISSDRADLAQLDPALPIIDC